MVPANTLFILLLLGLSAACAFVGKRLINRFVYFASGLTAIFGAYIVFIGGPFILSPLSRLFAFILLTITPLVTLYSTRYVRKSRGRFFLLIFLFAAAMYGFITADNIFLFFTFWEVMSICSFLLISFHHRVEDAVKAGSKCFILTQLGGILVLFALILLSAGTSSLSITVITANLGNMPRSAMFLPAILIALGAMSKSSILPFSWIPDAMKAPTPVSALLHSATMVNAGVFILVRFLPLVGRFPSVLAMVIVFSFASMLYACFSALRENDVKRILAFSTVTNLSYIFATLALFSALSEAASVFHLLNHAFLKAGLFLMVGMALGANHSLEFLKGAAHRLGSLKYVFVFFVLAACGIPPTNAFLSKWSIYNAWLTVFPPGIILIATGTIVTIAYYSRVLQVFFRPGRNGAFRFRYAISIAPIAFICLLFGISTLGYAFFIEPIVHPVLLLKANVSLFLLVFSFIGGVVFFSHWKISIDKTGPFVGGEEIKLKMPVTELFREYGSLLRKVPMFFDVNIIYKRVSRINVYMKRVARSDSAVSEKFVIATIVLAFAVFLLEVFL